MLVRGGSPVNGALSAFCGPTAEKSPSHRFLVCPSSCGESGRAPSSVVRGVCDLPLEVLLPLPRPLSSSSGRNGRDSSVMSFEERSLAFSAAAAALRLRATSGYFGQAGLFAAGPSACGEGRLRLGGTTRGARSR